jgi:putative nucleotidyltransferase with HDIG domain
MSMFQWAFQVVEAKLAGVLPRRWSHVQGVARQARTLRAISRADHDLLEAAAILHDIGYAPELVRTGFHPLDGAVYLAEIDAPERLVNLVAHHSFAAHEAALRGLSDELSCFRDEGGRIRDALWYCDLTTSPDGDKVGVRERLQEIQQRYGPSDLVTRFITEASEELMAAVDRTAERLVAVSST